MEMKDGMREGASICERKDPSLRLHRRRSVRQKTDKEDTAHADIDRG
jgi:hypothetical protein